MKRVKFISLMLVVLVLFTACSSKETPEIGESSQESQATDSVMSSEEINESEIQSDVGDSTEASSAFEMSTGNQVSSSSGASDSQHNAPPAAKPSQKPSTTPSGGNSSSTTPSVPTPPSNGGGSGSSSSSKPTEKPVPHTHNWKKQPKGQIFEWENSCGPDENGYTNNRDIAQNKNGKKIGIYMCAICYKYYGGVNNDWENRFWDHIEQDGPCKGAGYCAYPVYAIYDAFHCEGCDAWKRGNFSMYGYYDYSNGAKWIFLQPWQIDELNLKRP